MAQFQGPISLADTGTTGNNTGTGEQIGAEAIGVILQFVIESAGATPTVTFKFQGSIDNDNWYDIYYVTDSTDTAAASTRVVTDEGAYIAFLSNTGSRKYRYYRCVTTANTNVTYRAELYTFD